ncbi:hypothetical protein N7492_001844 [Penicillium capsulatum]|uniref:Uncharacterized protein n=1 Tax=Penicillium capsulatum TaxID=69766 RepID=A0A9W9IS96_9EURO|nr:hypothetical protein N7492_001844 [Penicillium capsulatum]
MIVGVQCKTATKPPPLVETENREEVEGRNGGPGAIPGTGVVGPITGREGNPPHEPICFFGCSGLVSPTKMAHADFGPADPSARERENSAPSLGGSGIGSWPHHTSKHRRHGVSAKRPSVDKVHGTPSTAYRIPYHDATLQYDSGTGGHLPYCPVRVRRAVRGRNISANPDPAAPWVIAGRPLATPGRAGSTRYRKLVVLVPRPTRLPATARAASAPMPPLLPRSSDTRDSSQPRTSLLPLSPSPTPSTLCAVIRAVVNLVAI